MDAIRKNITVLKAQITAILRPEDSSYFDCPPPRLRRAPGQGCSAHFCAGLFGSLRRRAGFAAANRAVRCGAVTFIQRFGDALNLKVHFHLLALDGIYAEDEMGYIRFHQAAPPSDAEVARVTERIHCRIARLLERRGLGPQSRS